ncbi:hypothetical protein J6590_020342 [Homalodisca vitripennis]|nr:hypothetical protein J6590_020342 [Homalodisca vitripennis]
MDGHACRPDNEDVLHFHLHIISLLAGAGKALKLNVSPISHLCPGLTPGLPGYRTVRSVRTSSSLLIPRVRESVRQRHSVITPSTDPTLVSGLRWNWETEWYQTYQAYSAIIRRDLVSPCVNGIQLSHLPLIQLSYRDCGGTGRQSGTRRTKRVVRLYGVKYESVRQRHSVITPSTDPTLVSGLRWNWETEWYQTYQACSAIIRREIVSPCVNGIQLSHLPLIQLSYRDCGGTGRQSGTRRTKRVV